MSEVGTVIVGDDRGARSVLAEVVVALRSDGQITAQRIVERMRSEVRAFAEREPGDRLWAHTQAAALANLHAFLEAVQRGTPGVLPPEATAAARYAAASGLGLTDMMHAYRVGQRVALERIAETIDGIDADPDAKRRALDYSLRLLFDYLDAVADAITAAHESTRDQLLRTREQQRMRLVRALVDGTSVDASGLGYDLALEHFGVVAWGEGADAAIEALAERLGRRALAVAVAEHASWGWLGGTRSFGAVERRALERFAPPDGVSIATGAPASGEQGFRLTHRQALEAQRLALRRPAPLTRYEDVALEVVGLQDEGLARAFVEAELGRLDGPGEKASRLRNTLLAYLATSQNAAATAARLGVHERTVRYRLQAVEELLGRPVGHRAAELELALRLRSYLG